MHLAVIPARGGSKRIPGKNIRLLGGKPLVCYTIEAALGCTRLDKVIVSSDIPEVRELVLGYDTPRLLYVERPAELSGDLVTTEDVLLHVLKAQAAEAPVESLVTLLPTSPFRGSEVIDECMRLFLENGADSVCTFSQDKLKLGRFDPTSRRFSLLDENTPAEMHKIGLTAFDNPSTYVTRPEILAKLKFVLGPNNYGVLIDKFSGIDINDEIDWMFAEAILRAKRRQA